MKAGRQAFEKHPIFEYFERF